MLKVSRSAFTYSLNLFLKLWAACQLDPLKKSSRIFSSAAFNSETAIG